MVPARTFVMDDLDLKGHDLDLQGFTPCWSDTTPEQFKLPSPYLHQICIMVWARNLFIMDDLDLPLHGHDLDLQGHYTL